VKTGEKQLEWRRDVWTLVGPLCILCTLGFAYLRPTATPYFLPWAALLGLALSWKWKIKGLGISLGLLAGIILFRFLQISLEDKLWELTLAAALATGFLTTALSAEEVAALYQVPEPKPDTNLIQKVGHLEHELAHHKAKIEEHGKHIDSYEKLLTLAREEVVAGQGLLEKMRLELVKQKQRAKAEEDKLEDMLKTLRRELAQRDQTLAETKRLLVQPPQKEDTEKETLRNELTTLKHVLQETQTALEQQCSQKEDWQKMRQTEGLYQQLREQFAEKSATLDATRKELFLAQEALETLRHETEERLHYERTHADSSFDKHVKNLEGEIERLSAECHRLEDLVTSLMSAT